MPTDPRLRSQVDSLWDKLWSGGHSNPLDAIEQLSYLLFLKRLDDDENRKEKSAHLREQSFTPHIPGRDALALLDAPGRSQSAQTRAGEGLPLVSRPR